MIEEIQGKNPFDIPLDPSKREFHFWWKEGCKPPKIKRNHKMAYWGYKALDARVLNNPNHRRFNWFGRMLRPLIERFGYAA